MCDEREAESYKCISDNNYEYSKCEDQFSAYRACKKRMMHAIRAAKRAGEW